MALGTQEESCIAQHSHFFPYLNVVRMSHCLHLVKQAFLVWVSLQESNVADLTGESTPSEKKPRREWSQWTEAVLQMQDEHLPHWVIARYTDSPLGLLLPHRLGL